MNNTTIGEVFTEEEIEAGYADNFDWDAFENDKNTPSYTDGWGYALTEDGRYEQK